MRHKNDQTNSGNYKNWYEGHKPHCAVNYQGSSGAMECQAGVDIFLRSIGKRNLHYTVFVGDGDSASYGKVCEACVDMYSYPVAKEECVGHIQKRMGSGLREFKRKMGQKLADGKTVGGIGRLTAGVIDRIQNNYGEAIRTNNDVQSMKNAVRAIYNHMIKDDNLLIHCLQGLTQNQNESVNNMLWSICPKTVLCCQKA